MPALSPPGGVGRVGAIVERLSARSMLLAFVEEGSDCPTPGTCPGRISPLVAPAAGVGYVRAFCASAVPAIRPNAATDISKHLRSGSISNRTVFPAPPGKPRRLNVRPDFN